MFNRDKDLLAFGTMAIGSWFLMMPVIGFQIIAANFFQAIGRSKVSYVSYFNTSDNIPNSCSNLLFPQLWGVEGLLYAAPFADLLAAILTGYFFIEYI
jgi:Na+-driven multidrug efflux pump